MTRPEPWEVTLRARAKGYAPLTVRVDRSDLRRVFQELDRHRARLARIEALADEWERSPYLYLSPHWQEDTIRARALRAALAAPTPDEVQPEWRDCGQHPCMTCDKPGRREVQP